MYDIGTEIPHTIKIEDIYYLTVNSVTIRSEKLLYSHKFRTKQYPHLKYPHTVSLMEDSHLIHFLI